MHKFDLREAFYSKVLYIVGLSIERITCTNYTMFAWKVFLLLDYPKKKRHNLNHILYKWGAQYAGLVSFGNIVSWHCYCMFPWNYYNKTLNHFSIKAFRGETELHVMQGFSFAKTVVQNHSGRHLCDCLFQMLNPTELNLFVKHLKVNIFHDFYKYWKFYLYVILLKPISFDQQCQLISNCT